MKIFGKIFLTSVFLSLFFIVNVADASNDIQTCGDVSVEIKGFGAGLMFQPRPVRISGQHLSTVNINEKCAVVEWATDVPATSQVVFNEFGENGSIHALNTEKENFGYKHASPQNNSAYVYHRAILPDLEPGKAYSYRIVSRDYPGGTPTVSEERVLIIPANAPVQENNQDNNSQTTTSPVVSLSNSVFTPVNYVTKPVVETLTYNVTTTVPVEDSETESLESVESDSDIATSTVADEEESDEDAGASDLELASVPSALNSIYNIDSQPGDEQDESSPFWERLKRSFSFIFGVGGSTDADIDLDDVTEDSDSDTEDEAKSTIVPLSIKLGSGKDDAVEKIKDVFETSIKDNILKKDVANTTDLSEEKVETDENEATTTIDMAGLLARTSFLIPTAFLLLFVFLLQQIVLPMIGVIVERPLIFWMFAVIILAIVSGIFAFYQITLVMTAIFLALLAYYMLKTASEDVSDTLAPDAEVAKS